MVNEHTYYQDGHPGGRRGPGKPSIMRYRTVALCGRQLPEGYINMANKPKQPPNPGKPPGQGPGKQGPIPPVPPKK